MNPDLTKLRRSPREVARWQRAQENLLGGRHSDAIRTYRELARAYPGIAELWFELGNAATGMLDFTTAIDAYQRARKLAVGNPPLLALIGQQYQTLRQPDSARECYRDAVTASPDSVDARINLAVWLEKERQLDEAMEQVEHCLAKHPRDDQARYFKAFLLHRKREDSQAETALRDLIRDAPAYPYVKYASRHLLGVVLDRLGQYGEAFQWLKEAKSIVRTIADTRALEQGYDEGDRRRRALLSALTPDAMRRWRDEGPATAESWQPAFLGGHPRSGTTLLEQILGAHPDLLAFDEPDSFQQEITRHIALPAAMGQPELQQLDRLSTDKLAGMRQRYFTSLLREVPGEPQARVLLDKNPSPTLSLNIWLRIFPELKVIIALRDPRDVVVSCFFMNIVLNSTNVNFLSLERTAKHYSDLMDVWLRMRELGGFDWIESRYEDVVADMSTEGRRVTEFLGLAWHPDQEKFHEAARRKILNAPTYHDVTRQVYKTAVGRWQHYAAELEPLQEKLAPYCKAFGYD
ncbi:MAG: sulfotransferase [Luteolibacter sp.]